MLEPQPQGGGEGEGSRGAVTVWQFVKDQWFEHWIEQVTNRQSGRGLITVVNHQSMLDDPVSALYLGMGLGRTLSMCAIR